MKTAERILLTALELFNQNGEAAVTSVDIANELDISPGNLYYHFKGKEVILSALFSMFKERMDRLLGPQNPEAVEVEDFFYYLYLVLETAHLFRFLYRNPLDLAEQHPEIARGFQRVITAKEKTIGELLQQYRQQQLLALSDVQHAEMVELVGLVFTQAPNYYLLKQQNIDDEQYIAKSLSMVLFALAPYLRMPEGKMQELRSAIAEQRLGLDQ